MPITTWNQFLEAELKLPYAEKLLQFLHHAYRHSTIYPDKENLFNAFETCPLQSLKVIIIGQDPYHQPGQAHGLAFSVKEGLPLPPSLRNIYKEIEQDTQQNMNFQSGDLTYLAHQGVLLLNSILTVESNQPLSHQRIGYETFFEHVMTFLDTLNQPMMFLLWGGWAKKAQKWIHNPHHHAQIANHPSPLSANRGGWFGTKHFSKTNQWLLGQGLTPIHWSNIT
jgi:uracil-DNA glycosylase